MSWTEHDSRRLLDMARYAAQLPEFDDGILGLAEEAVARIAELEATQTPERIAAWCFQAKLEGAREEREAVLAWLRGEWFRDGDPASWPKGNTNEGRLAAARWAAAEEIERGDHEKGGDK